MTVCISHPKDEHSRFDTKKQEFKFFGLPVLGFATKGNGRIRVYLFGVKTFSFKKPARRPKRPNVKPVIIPKDPTAPKGVIYTCITGGYDNLVRHNCVNQNFDYICFTDNEKLLKKKRVGIWQFRPLVFDKLDATRNNRWHKMHPHILFPKDDLSIYIDGNINVLTPKLFDIVKANAQKKLSVPLHYARDCVYDEANEVILDKRDTPENIRKILDFLKKEKMPAHYGLTENNILIRHHKDPLVKKMMDEWWSFIEKVTKRDQLSFSYILWKNGIKIKDICFDNARFDYKNYYFELHSKKRKQK